MMSVEENKAVVRRFFSEFANHRNLSVADELVSEDFVMHLPNGRELNGIESVKQVYIQNGAASPDITYEIEDIVAEKDKVAFRITIQGTQMGYYRNLAPTGKKITVSRFAIMHLNNGKFLEGWVLDDSLSLYQQLGALPPTEEIGN